MSVSDTVNVGRLPDQLSGCFSTRDFATPRPEHETLFVKFEQQYSCHLVSYRSGCLADAGPAHLCSNAHVVQLTPEMEHELRILEATVGNHVVAYECPWRFRTSDPECLRPVEHELQNRSDQPSPQDR